MERERALGKNKEGLAETSFSLPIFTYGTLRGEGMEVNTGNSSILLGRFVVRGLVLGIGDKYPCVDITFNTDDRVYGEGIELCDKSPEALDKVDQYEGVNEGYYQRRIVFASPEDSPGLFVPMWVYARGKRLTK